MKIDRLKIVNYKLFQNVTVEMNDSINIFVGENDSGKTTILEALSMALTGKVNGSSMANRLNLDWFNAAVRTKFKQSVANGEIPELPSIEIANKLGLQHLHLVANNSTTPFKALKKDTYDYFLKLPGYNTLRILLANEAILVEGPADELIIQRAYMDNYGKQPIEFGIDVIAVDSLAFQRYCELASLICKHLTIVTDNDGNANEVINRYKKYGDLVTLCIEQDDSRRTLEPSVLAANIDSFEEFRAIIYQGKDIRTRDAKSILNFMLGNKTEWSMRVFTNEKNIVYPQYILKAIGITNEGKDDNEASADE